jgi:hypothetical protein
MPRYFFHMVGSDEEGTELPDDAAARAQARETFGTMIRDGDIQDAAKMEVLDSEGQRVALLSYLAER